MMHKRIQSDGMGRRVRTACVSLFFFCVLGFALGVVPAPGHTATTPEMKRLIREALKEDPNLVLDVLRENSEVVLEVAQEGNMQRKRKAMLAQWEQDARTPKTINIRGAAIRGDVNAPVTIIAFSDFTCSFCRQSEMMLPPLLEKYRGKVRFVFKPLPKDDYPVSVLATKYATAAFMQDPARGWAFYDAVFAGADTLESQGENFLKKAAVDAGLDLKRLTQEVNGAKVREALAATRDEADGLNIQGTPYFFVNNLVVRGSIPKDLFEEAIQIALRKAGR